MRYLKKVTLPQQCRHHRILRVCMNTASCIPLIERVPKQGCTRRFFQVRFWATEKDAIGVRGRGGLWIGQDEDVRGFNPFFLNTRWGNENLVPGTHRKEISNNDTTSDINVEEDTPDADTDPTPSASDPSKPIKPST